MNPIAEEMASYLGQATLTDEEFFQHYGVKRRSGRYPYGSGEDPYQHGRDFLARVDELREQGWEETPENIKAAFGLTVKQYRMEKSICKDERRMLDVARAKSLRKDGLNNMQIGKKMGVGESTVRSWFDEEAEANMRRAKETADLLRKEVDKKRMIDVGSSVELELGVSREKLDTAIYMLEKEGYKIHGGRVPQPTNKNQLTTLKVLCKPDVEHKEIFEYDKIQTIKDYVSKDGGITFEKKFTYPTSLDKSRLYIRYPDEGGADKDGIIELRRGVPDLDLQGARYSQVRILVGNKSYLKGMAVYSDDMPDGVDVVFNTSKKRGEDEWNVVMKKIKNDPENPFGSAIKDAELGGQYWYNDPKTGKKKLGLINKRADEGDWTDWKDALPSQFLSKQTKQLAKQQLELAKAYKYDEYDQIMKLNNPTIKKHYLEKFASDCDSAAVDLKAAALPGQRYHVIIPNNTLKNNEVYAPGYANGTKLALVRYPHGGTFEIPLVTVNNKNSLGKKLIGTDPIDAICINSKIASQLSGADFDGDTVMCIPTHGRNSRIKISSQNPLDSLKGFETSSYRFDKEVKDADGTVHYYRNGKEFKPMKSTNKNKEMGVISNLITDMTLLGATNNEIARAVKHSMVVIDAEKHKLDWKQSYIDNNIAALQKQYQPKYDKDGNLIGGGGASTIISRSKGDARVPKRKGEAKINIKGKSWYDPKKPEGSLIYTVADDKDLYYVDSTYNKKTGVNTLFRTDGKKVTYNSNDADAKAKYEPVKKKDPKTGKYELDIQTDPKTGKKFVTNKDGTIKYRLETRTIGSTNMAETDDAMTLVSRKRHQMELIYVDYANSMKSLANRARIEMINTGNLEYSPTANKVYKKEVSSLMAQLNDAKKNTNRERTATRLAAAEIKRRKEQNPDMTPSDEKKLSQRLMSKYRGEVNSVSRKNRGIKISDKEWEAIQAGAITENKLKEILNNSDPDILRQRAMPKSSNTLSQAQINRIKRMRNSDFTLSQIAEKMNISPSAVSSILKGES